MNERQDCEPEACVKHYAEEDWIDWLLGGKPAAERDAMLRHLAHCARCLATRQTWEPLLAGDMNAAAQHTAPERLRAEAVQPQSGEPWPGSAPAAGGLAARDPQPEPPILSAALYRRLRLRFQLRSAGLRVRRALHAQRRVGIVAAAAAMLLVVCATGLYRSSQNQEEQRKVSAATLEPTAATFLLDPQTAGYKVHPELEELGDGYIWFNNMSGEVYVMLEGLLPSVGHDVQVWAVDETKHEHVNLGLLHRDQASRAHLYVKQSLLLQAHHLALTVEPSGGSRNPTEPEVLVFKLQRG